MWLYITSVGDSIGYSSLPLPSCFVRAMKMTISSELRDWRRAVSELIDDQRKEHKKSPLAFWFFIGLGFLYGLMVACNAVFRP